MNEMMSENGERIMTQKNINIVIKTIINIKKIY